MTDLTGPIIRTFGSLIHWILITGFWFVIIFLILLMAFMFWLAWRNIKITMEERKAKLEHQKYLKEIENGKLE